MRGGGWCLEWLHPPPKGFNVKGEREKERLQERERLREKMIIHVSFIPHKGVK